MNEPLDYNPIIITIKKNEKKGEDTFYCCFNGPIKIKEFWVRIGKSEQNV
jgi:hypothetical protein